MYSKRYKEIIEYGWLQNKHTKNRIAKKEEAKLLRRLDKYYEKFKSYEIQKGHYSSYLNASNYNVGNGADYAKKWK